MNYTVSIIITTYNRSEFIIRMLNSFINQTYDKNLYEIIICDNHSTDNTNQIINNFKKEHADFRITCLYEERQGVHYARNLAAKQAIGEILYFTDDDMVADSHLLENIIKPFEDDSVGIVTGKILPIWQSPPKKWVVRYLNNALLSLNDMGDKDFISEDDIAYSCHEAVKREAFFVGGGFHPDYIAGELIGDGETGMNDDIKKLGYKFFYKADSVIWHIIPKSRMTQAYLNKRLKNLGNCISYSEHKISPINKQSDLVHNRIIYIKTGIRQLFTFLKYYKFSYVRFIVAYYHYWKARIQYDKRLLNDSDFRALVEKDNWLQD